MPNRAEASAKRSNREEPVSISPTRIWRFLDGKMGHKNQSRGLVEALSRLVPTEVLDLNATTNLNETLSTKEPPDLIIGAGHQTHQRMLRAKRATKARAVVLMRPSFRLHHFDLCVIPEHDNVTPSNKILVTRGVLNPFTPVTTAVASDAVNPSAGNGLILVGGPSKHHDWLSAELLAQISIITAKPGMTWTIGNSRRTPDVTTRALKALASEHIQFVDWADADATWIGTTLANSEHVWVSEDSVSMLYEALTVGAGVGVLGVPRRSYSRVVRGVAALVRDGCVTPFVLWQAGRALRPMRPALAESDRCARWIVDHWLQPS
jgi:uncharacterized protein